MIFGIKTKKDKKIEMLEEDISKKIDTIMDLVQREMGRPYIGPARSFDYIPLRATYTISDDLPLDIVKNIIVSKFSDYLKDVLSFDVIEVEGEKMLEGTLYVRRK